MSGYDLVIRNGTVATAADTALCDAGIRAGLVVTLGCDLGPGAREIDAAGKLVLPGGIDSHCHIEQRSSAGVVCRRRQAGSRADREGSKKPPPLPAYYPLSAESQGSNNCQRWSRTVRTFTKSAPARAIRVDCAAARWSLASTV